MNRKASKTKTSVAVILGIVLALFAVASIASAQITTTPVTTGRGWVDYNACDVIAGWSLDSAAREIAVSIRIYKGPEKTLLVYDKPTNGLRPDVNAAFGLVPTEDVPHKHGFHVKTPVALRTGGPVPVLVVGVTAEGEEYTLNGGEFVLICAAPPAIEVRITNERGMNLSNEGLGVYLTLYRINEEGIAEWVASTDCARNLGCANANGSARFAPSDLGFELEEASYQVRAQAGYHHDDTQDLFYSAQYGGYANHVLRLHEVIIGVSSPSYKFLSGTASTATITVCNFGIGGANPLVGFDVITRGLGRNSSYVDRPTEYGFFLPLVGEPCYEFQWAVGVSADLPNGHWFNFEVRFKNRNRKDEVYGSNSWSAAKVAFLTAVPLGDTAMRADAKPTEIPWALLGIQK